MQSLSGHQLTDLLTSLMNMSLALRLPGEMHLARSSANVPRLPSFLEMVKWHKTLAFCSLLATRRIPCACHAERRHLNVKKWSEPGVSIFFHLQMCFAPQRRALFWTSQLPKVLRSWSVLYVLTCKPASRHNAVQLFISHLARWLRARRLSEPTFRPSGAPNHWQNTMFRDFPTFSRTCIFFLLTLFLLWSSLFCSSLLWLFPPLLFHLSILSEVWLLNFLR